MQRLIRQSRGVLEASPPASEEEGAVLWASTPVYGLCLNAGSVLTKMGKHREAVQFLQSVKVRRAQTGISHLATLGIAPRVPVRLHDRLRPLRSQHVCV